MTTDDLAYEAMRLIHAKNLRFTFSDGATTYSARLTPRVAGEDKENKTPDEKLDSVVGQDELKNPLAKGKGKEKEVIEDTAEKTTMGRGGGAVVVQA